MTGLAGQQALAAAERLLDPAPILTAVPGADGASLASGLAGTALLHARLASVDAAFAAAAVRHWAAAAAQARRHPAAAAGIHHSPGGLAASLIIGSAYLPDPGSQQGAATRAARWLSCRALSLARRQQERLQAGGALTSWAAYDVISGLAGIGRILLAAADGGHDRAACEPGLTATLNMLTTMILTRRGKRPGWWLPPSAHPPSVTLPPSGAANTGMAHGIAGPLALLSTACITGWEVTRQRAAIADATQWLLRWRDPASRAWPPHVTGQELDAGTAAPARGRRDAWCYGTPGISRALALAGRALADAQLIRTADSAIASLASRPAECWDTAGPALCHGYAGVLQCAADSPGDTASRAAAVVTAAFSSRYTFSFQQPGQGSDHDEPGLLTGAAGVALALADHDGLPAPAVPARWDSALLLS